MDMTLSQLLELKQIKDDFGNIHFIAGENTVVASILVNRFTTINAELGDDMSVIPFSFDLSGPMAIIYCPEINLADLDTLGSISIVCAMMSVVTFADISTVPQVKEMRVDLTTVHQYDEGDYEKYQLARELICHHTEQVWDDDFLRKKYAYQQNLRNEWMKSIMSNGDMLG